MIPEKMLELLILDRVSNLLFIDGLKINQSEVFKRRNELLLEFLEPYVISNAPNGD